MPLIFIYDVVFSNSHKVLTKVTYFLCSICCIHFPSVAADDLYSHPTCSELALSGPITARLSVNWKHFQTDLQFSGLLKPISCSKQWWNQAQLQETASAAKEHMLF